MEDNVFTKLDFFDLKKGLRALFLALDQTDSTFFHFCLKYKIC